jgi:hypothetical protein
MVHQHHLKNHERQSLHSTLQCVEKGGAPRTKLVRVFNVSCDMNLNWPYIGLPCDKIQDPGFITNEYSNSVFLQYNLFFELALTSLTLLSWLTKIIEGDAVIL